MAYTLVATAKNEAPYLLEWVAFHRAIGFDNILIFQNDSDDLTHETLQVMHEIGAVRYRYNNAPPGRHQIRAYRRATRQPEYQGADWVLALDLDEFLQIHTGEGRLDDLFDALPEADQILLNWHRFGNGGQTEITDDLVTARFEMAEADGRITEWLTPYKAMFRPAHFERPGVHRPAGAKIPEEQLRTCNGSGLAADAFDQKRFRSRDPNKRRLAQINHYIVRDAASFVLKSYRGSAHQSGRGIDKSYWLRRNFNEEPDTRLARRAAWTQAQMKALDATSGGRLSLLRLAATRLHQERFTSLMKEPAYRDLMAFCCTSPSRAAA